MHMQCICETAIANVIKGISPYITRLPAFNYNENFTQCYKDNFLCGNNISYHKKCHLKEMYSVLYTLCEGCLIGSLHELMTLHRDI